MQEAPDDVSLDNLEISKKATVNANETQVVNEDALLNAEDDNVFRTDNSSMRSKDKENLILRIGTNIQEVGNKSKSNVNASPMLSANPNYKIKREENLKPKFSTTAPPKKVTSSTAVDK